MPVPRRNVSGGDAGLFNDQSRFCHARKRRSLRRLTKHETLLIFLFVLTLPLSNPWVHGDGVGYYAYVRALLIEGNLDFEKDWQHGNESFVMGRLDASGHVLSHQYTATGHLENLWSIGPSLLWAPFLVVTHLGVLAADRLGAHVPADGFSAPYLITMAVTTAVYGFLGLWISFCLARKYFDERWSFLATLGIWWGSSLPVYMYFNPSWSHAHSAFAVALFLWYWHRTRGARTIAQWVLLGLLSGLMVNVYYPNGILLSIPLLEAVEGYYERLRAESPDIKELVRLFAAHVVYVLVFACALLPTLVSRQVIFGSAVSTGYMPAQTWFWSSPKFWDVLFSADHGVLSWTPILILSLLGLAFFRRADRPFARYLIVATVAFWILISFYPDWDGLSSFGNRFFVSLTTVFILGLSAFFDRLARAWNERRAVIVASAATAIFVVWNAGLIFQWGTHLIPARGPISWRSAAYNQVAVVPEQAVSTVKSYLTRRKKLMDRIEQEDVKQIKSQRTEGTE